MSNTYAIAGLVSQLDLPSPMTAAHRLSFESSPIDVTFENGEIASLDPTNPLSAAYAEILRDLRQSQIPGYVEIDSETRAISNLLIPIRDKVVALERMNDGDVTVELEFSQTYRILKHNNSQFTHLLSRLEESRNGGTNVLVTDTDNHEIVDVRPWETETTAQDADALNLAAEALSAEVVEFGELATEGAEVTPETATALPYVTLQRARQLFRWLASSSCNPMTVPSPCIPFLYPDDGCWGRAHEMCHRIVRVGNMPGKVWNYGDLQVNTRNNPNCYVRWGYHVAPILCILGWREYAVIDPSMFKEPVPISVWKKAQQDPNSQIRCTSWQVFYRSPNGQLYYDPNFTETAQVLATYRAQLRVRSLTIGPPPYANCR